jgi:hypothetical protein
VAPSLTTGNEGLSAGVLFAALIAAVLSKNMITSGVSYGDLVLVLVTIAGLRSALRSQVITHDLLWLLTLMLAAALGAIYSEFHNYAFDPVEFWISFVKLVFFATVTIVLGSAVTSLKPIDSTRIVSAVLLINAALGFYVYAAVALSLPLPYEFLWFGQTGDISSAYFEEEIVRMRGVFSEPSLLGAYQVLGLSYLLLVERTRPSNIVLIATVVSILVSFSLSAYALFLVLLAAYGSIAFGERRTLLSAAFLLVVCFGTAYLAGAEFQRTIVDRLLSVASGSDVSGIGRLVATWELPLEVTNTYPLFGAGLGNLDVIYRTIASSLTFELLLDETPQGWNVVAYLLGCLGFVGLIIFVALHCHWARVVGLASSVFIAYLFTTGAWLEPTYWVFFALFYHRAISLSNDRAMPDLVTR